MPIKVIFFPIFIHIILRLEIGLENILFASEILLAAILSSILFHKNKPTVKLC